MKVYNVRINDWHCKTYSEEHKNELAEWVRGMLRSSADIRKLIIERSEVE